ncbi:MAG: TrmB family transcriptional regulator [Patescibacteria group bacterium]
MKELKDFLAEYGFTDKESSVYLTMLELGPASVQDIAKKAGVNRATTYVMIESLKRRGLMSTFEQGKKTMFVAESPERLKRLIENDMQIVHAKEKHLQDLLPSFLGLYNAASEERPNVKFFEGEEGFRASRDWYLKAQGEFFEFVSVDENMMRLSNLDEDKRMSISNNKKGRIIAGIKSGIQMPKYNSANWPTRTVPYEMCPFNGELIGFDDKITITIFKTKPLVYLIHDKDTYSMMRAMFELIWQNAKPLE